MLYVAVTPTPVWLALIALCAGGLAWVWRRLRGDTLIRWAVAVSLGQLAVGLFALIQTARHSIGAPACLTGFFGSFAGIGIAALLAGAVLLWPPAWAHLRRRVPVLPVLAAAQACAILVTMRSALLCTV